VHHFKGEYFVLIAQNIVNNHLLKKAIAAISCFVAIMPHAQFR